VLVTNVTHHYKMSRKSHHAEDHKMHV